MERKKQEKQPYDLKDRQVPPVKGAVQDLQDVVRKPAGIFGPAHPAEPVSVGNPALFDIVQ